MDSVGEKGRILPAKDIHRSAKQRVKEAKKRQGKPLYIVMNPEDLDDVRQMLRRTIVRVAGVQIRTLDTMARGKLGIQWEEGEDDEQN